MAVYGEVVGTIPIAEQLRLATRDGEVFFQIRREGGEISRGPGGGPGVVGLAGKPRLFRDELGG